MVFAPHMEAIYGASGFFNVGDWSRGASSVAEACAHLVERHIRDWPQPQGARPRILDVGCGLGAGTAVVARCYPSAQIMGLNLSTLQLQHAQKLHPGPAYCAMDACRLALADASADSIVSVEAAFHFGDRTAFLREAFRVLKPGGLMAVSDILFTGSAWTGNWSVSANAPCGLSGYASLCTDAGFQVDSVEDITSDTWLSFCRHLCSQGFPALADEIEPAAGTYLLARLSKPQR